MSTLMIGDVCSRIRNTLKAVRVDSFLTDRAIYSVFKKYAALSIKRLDEKKRLSAFASIFETLDYVQLVELDKVEASQCGVAPKSYSTIRRTCIPIPVFMEGIWGPMIRSVTSLDGTVSLKLTTPDAYSYLTKSSGYQFNKQKYVWYLNDHLYFPDIDWPAVRIDAMCSGDISAFKCNSDQKCQPRQRHSVNIPDYILAEIEQATLQEFMIQLKVPEDDKHDNQNALR